MSDSIEPPVDSVKNIILLSVDSLRVDRLHSERNGIPLTPNIDALAEKSIEFEQAISPGPSTRDTMPSLMTGAFPSQFADVGLPDRGSGPQTLPEQLSAAEFSTAGFSNNNFISRKYNHDRGFDRYYDVSVEGRKEQSRGAWRIPVRNAIEETLLMDVAHSAHSFLMEHFGMSLFLPNEGGENLTDRALKWLKDTQDNKFLWLHYMDTHHPYTSPESVQEQYGTVFPKQYIKKISEKTRSEPNKITDEELEELNYMYDCTVRHADNQVGRVIDHLKLSGELDQSIIVLTADHGEAFGEHGDFGHTNGLWDELIRVPLIIHHPDIESTTVEKQVPLRLLRRSLVEGEGLFNMLDTGQEYVVSEVPDFRAGMRSCRGHSYKVIIQDSNITATHIRRDAEKIIGINEIPEEVRTELNTRIDVDREPIDVSVDVSEDELRKDLEALGYLE